LELVRFGGFVSIISVQLQCNQVRVGGLLGRDDRC
jgi:hypothetical protein